MTAHHGVCLLSCDAPVDVNVTGLHATQALQGLADHDGAAAQGSTLALHTHMTGPGLVGVGRVVKAETGQGEDTIKLAEQVHLYLCTVDVLVDCSWILNRSFHGFSAEAFADRTVRMCATPHAAGSSMAPSGSIPGSASWRCWFKLYCLHLLAVVASVVLVKLLSHLAACCQQQCCLSKCVADAECVDGAELLHTPHHAVHSNGLVLVAILAVAFLQEQHRQGSAHAAAGTRHMQHIAFEKTQTPDTDCWFSHSDTAGC
jgi:hypothetical protein